MVGLALAAKESGGDEGFDRFMAAWDAQLEEAQARKRRESLRLVRGERE